MEILDFANELLLMVGENLSIGDLSKFRSTSQRLCLVLTPRYKKLCLEDIGKLTALQWAALRGHIELIELAILNGADIEMPFKGILDKTAPHMSDRPRSVCQFVNRAYLQRPLNAIHCTPLYLAACSGKDGAIKTLLNAGARMQCRDRMDTPAHVSATKGDISCMQAFIAAGFDIITKGTGDRTILHQAMFGGVKMVKYLLMYAGGKKLVNVKDYFSHTPLHYVAGCFPVRYNRKVITQLLLQHGADIHVVDWYGNTPAHLAAFPGDVDTMRVLIAAGSGFHAKGLYGETILHRAMGNRKGVLEYLLRQEGVREIIHLKDNNGRTPLCLAQLVGQGKAAERLEKMAENT